MDAAKLLTWMRRVPGLGIGEFRSHWVDRHALLGLRMPGMVGYVQCIAVAGERPGDDPPFDGLAETWWSPPAVLRSHEGTQEWRDLLEDEAGFIESPRRTQLLVDEIVVKDGERESCRSVRFEMAKRPAGFSVGEFVARCRAEIPEAGALDDGGVVRLDLNLASPASYAQGRQPSFDVVVATWCGDDVDEADAARWPPPVVPEGLTGGSAVVRAWARPLIRR